MCEFDLTWLYPLLSFNVEKDDQAALVSPQVDKKVNLFLYYY